MCGFAGVIAWDERYRVSRETLAKMSAAIAHRGPDGEGFHINHEGAITPDHPQVALAFRRLAILDPDPRSDQPFTDGRHWLVFNGEIYNFRELKKELSALAPDYQWKTTGDTEVLLRAYAVWCEKCVEHLNGMFAFAVWDEVEKNLFLARDRMGQKPLYYALGENWISFGSELSALMANPLFERKLSDESLVDYLNFGYVGADQTIYSGGRQLLPSTWIKGGLKRWQHQYFNRMKCVGAHSGCSTKALVIAAVERQLISDVSLGVFLSGGMDSSIIAACARSFGPVHTYSIGFDDPKYDETRYARRVADFLGTDHHIFNVKVSAANDLPRLAAAFAEPFGDSSALPAHYLAQQTSKHVKVALSGDGGDELFGGYDRYRALLLSQKIGVFPRWFITLIVLVSKTLPESHPKSILQRLKRLANGLNLTDSRRYESYVELFGLSRINELRGKPWITEQWAEDHDTFSGEFESLRKYHGLDLVQAAAAMDRIGYLPDDLLTKVDRCSMLHGLEVRSPFMDHELVQFASGLTTDQLLKGGPKRMLREAFKDDLPAWVFKRKKMGFAVPIGDWFRGELRAMLRDTLFSSHAFGRSHFDMKVVERLVEEHESKRVDHSQRLYALLMLELWWDTVR